jgi:hypothetical protein
LLRGPLLSWLGVDLVAWLLRPALQQQQHCASCLLTAAAAVAEWTAYVTCLACILLLLVYW